MSRRFSPVRIDKGEMTPHGFYRVPATFTRTGVFDYVDKDGNIRRELRHPDDVFDDASLKSLQLAPLTLKHPKEFVNVENIKDHSTGHLGDQIAQDGNFVRGVVLITDKKAIAEAEKGTVELSCGYTADMVDEAGTYEGLPYDCRQTNIRYNHVAQVEAGRAGRHVRLHLDADDRAQVDKPTEDPRMEKLTIEGVDYDVPPEVAAYVKQLQEGEETEDAKLKAAEEQAKEKAAEADKAKGEAADAEKKADQLQAKLDAAEEKLKKREDSRMTHEQINHAVKSRMKVEKVAQAVLGADFKEDASDAELMKQVIQKSSSVSLEGKSDDYIRARFDGIAEETQRRQDTREDLGRKLGNKRTDADYDVKSAREKQTQEAAESWKQPLAASKK